MSSIFTEVKEIEGNISNDYCDSFKTISWVPKWQQAGTATNGNRAVYKRHGVCIHRTHIIQTDLLKSLNHNYKEKNQFVTSKW